MLLIIVGLLRPDHIMSPWKQDGGSLDQVLKEARRIPEEILGKVSIAVSNHVVNSPAYISYRYKRSFCSTLIGPGVWSPLIVVRSVVKLTLCLSSLCGTTVCCSKKGIFSSLATT